MSLKENNLLIASWSLQIIPASIKGPKLTSLVFRRNRQFVVSLVWLFWLRKFVFPVKARAMFIDRHFGGGDLFQLQD